MSSSIPKQEVKTAPTVDLSEFFKEAHHKKCPVPNILESLNEEQRKKVSLALISPEITHMMITKRLVEWSGAKINPGSVGRHRRNECACGRS